MTASVDDHDRPEQSLLDLGDLCNGLLYNPEETVTMEEAAVASVPRVPLLGKAIAAPQVCKSAEPELYHKPRVAVATVTPPTFTAATPASEEDDDSSGPSPCWGGMLKGDASCCTAGFTSGKAHFKNKFCANCRKGIEVPLSRVRAVHPDVRTLYANSLRAGFWKRSAPALGGGEVRIANNTITCDGPWLVVYREEQQPSAHRPPWAVDMPAGWASPEGLVQLSVAKGTLVPLAEMGAKKPNGKHGASSSSPNAGGLGFGGGPKRQRRAPSFAAPEEVPPGGLPPSVRRVYSGSSVLSSGALSSNGSPQIGPQAAAEATGYDSLRSSHPPMVVPGTRLPPPSVMVPSPSSASQHHVVGASLLSAASSAASVATIASPAPSPTSPAELALRLASTYEHAAAMLENALRPLSPVRTQLSSEQATELLSQLNATRAAIDTCHRLAKSVTSPAASAAAAASDG